MNVSLLQKSSDRSLQVAIIGLGYVGLPVATTFAEAGFRVTGIDIDIQKVEMAKRGESYIPDVASSTLCALMESERLHFTDDFAALDEADAVSIRVPTPLSKTRDPDISYIVAAAQQVRAHLHAGQLIVLESTTYPGTTHEVVLPELEQTGLQVGKDFFLAFSPERIDPGNPDYNTRNTPKIVGGVTPACTELAQVFYSTAIHDVVPVSCARTAAM